MMLNQPKPIGINYSQVPSLEEKKLRPFHAYREFLLRVAFICAFVGVVTLTFLVIASNLPIKPTHRSNSRIQHFPTYDKSFNDHYDQFKKFMFKFDKRYETTIEKEQRFANFRKTLEKVEKMNHLEKLTNTQFGINHFADMSEEEFQQMLMPKSLNNKSRNNTFIRKMPDHVKNKMDTAYPYPAHFDWRDKGVVTPVKAQGNCGSCWAFASASTVESAYAIEHGKLLNLSEQEFLDCNLENNACSGGSVSFKVDILSNFAAIFTKTFSPKIFSPNPLVFENFFFEEKGFRRKKGITHSGDVDKAFDFVMKFGLMLEDEYPYVAHRQNSCALAEWKGNTTKIDMAYFINPDENAIIEWLVTFGPVNVGISVPPDMKPYTGGVYRPSDWDCQFNVLGLHALNIVGYGTSDEGEKYWIVKNSWGQKWGVEEGYVYFARGVNACGIEDEPVGLLA